MAGLPQLIPIRHAACLPQLIPLGHAACLPQLISIGHTACRPQLGVSGRDRIPADAPVFLASLTGRPPSAISGRGGTQGFRPITLRSVVYRPPLISISRERGPTPPTLITGSPARTPPAVTARTTGTRGPAPTPPPVTRGEPLGIRNADSVFAMIRRRGQMSSLRITAAGTPIGLPEGVIRILTSGPTRAPRGPVRGHRSVVVGRSAPPIAAGSGVAQVTRIPVVAEETRPPATPTYVLRVDLRPRRA